MCSGEPLGYGGRAPWAGIGGADSSESLTLWEPSGHTLSLARAGFIGLTLLPNSNALSPGSSHWMASLSPMVSFSADPALLTTSHPPPYRKMAPGPCRFPSELSPPRTWLQMPPVLLREGPLPARAQGCPVSDSLRPFGLYSPWNSSGQNTGVGSCSLLQGIFPTQGLNAGLPHCRRILYQPSHQGSPCSSLHLKNVLLKKQDLGGK